MPLDVVCLGEPMLEFNQQKDGLYLPGFGGDTSNTAIAVARQGASAGYLTRLGDDAFGQDFRALWANENVDASAVDSDPAAHTAIYFVTHNEDGHAFSYFRAGSAASRMTPDWLPEDYVHSAKILHLSAITQGISGSAADTAFRAMEVAREAGVTVSYDTNLRLKLWPLSRARAVIHAACAMADIVLPGDGDAMQLTGLEEPEAICDFYLGLGAKIVALTLGEKGAFVATPDRSEMIAARKVSSVDATGAGDTFDGAFLAEIAAGRDPFQAARYANAAAGLSTQGYGAVKPIPRRADVEAFLASGE